MKTNYSDLQLLLDEASALTKKPNWTRADERRNAYLLAAISAVKNGVSLAEIDQQRLNSEEVRMGLRPTKLDRMSVQTRAKALFMQKLAGPVTDSREMRAINASESEGNLLAQIGTYTSLGHFVPTAFADQVYHTMAAHDPLFDPDFATVRYSKKASPMVIPVYDDISNVAVQIGEATDTSASVVKLGNPANVQLGAYSFFSPVHPFSQEVFQDLDEAAAAFDLFSTFAGDRCARGIGAKMITGTGGGTTINGILTALAALSVVGVTATGSSKNTGGAETGANSIGSADLASLYFKVNSAYRASPKAAWLMNDATLKFLSTIVTISGWPLVYMFGNEPQILGKRVGISPSMPNIGANNVPILFGNFEFWETRIVTDELTRIHQVTEAPGLIENGLVGLQYFMRADGVLAFNSPNPGNCPIQPLICAAS